MDNARRKEILGKAFDFITGEKKSLHLDDPDALLVLGVSAVIEKARDTDLTKALGPLMAILPYMHERLANAQIQAEVKTRNVKVVNQVWPELAQTVETMRTSSSRTNGSHELTNGAHGASSDPEDVIH